MYALAECHTIVALQSARGRKHISALYYIGNLHFYCLSAACFILTHHFAAQSHCMLVRCIKHNKKKIIFLIGIVILFVVNHVELS